MKIGRLKKFLVGCMMAVALLALPMVAAGRVHAADFEFAGDDCTSRTFLGLVPWDCGLTNGGISSTEGLKNAGVQIAVNVLQDVSVLAAYLVIGFVIYGGYLYLVSSGDSSKTASGKKTLINAFIGLAIVMASSVIMNAIRIALVGNSGNLAADCTTASAGCIPEGVQSNIMVTNLINWVLGVAAAVAVIFVLIGGISYITSRGDSGKLQKAKSTIIYALIGLAIVAFAEILTALVSTTIRSGLEAALVSGLYLA